MAKVDREIRVALRAHPDGAVPIVVVLRETTDQLADEVEAAGMIIQSRSLLSEGLLAGQADAACVGRLEQMDGVEFVTMDAVQRASML